MPQIENATLFKLGNGLSGLAQVEMEQRSGHYQRAKGPCPGKGDSAGKQGGERNAAAKNGVCQRYANKVTDTAMGLLQKAVSVTATSTR